MKLLEFFSKALGENHCWVHCYAILAATLMVMWSYKKHWIMLSINLSNNMCVYIYMKRSIKEDFQYIMKNW